MTLDSKAPLDKRGQFIPTRKSTLFSALLDDFCPPELAGQARQLSRLLATILHVQYMGDLERLHEAYHDLDPTLESGQKGAGGDETYKELSEALQSVLRGANFVECDAAELEHAARETGKIRYAVRTGVADFRAIRLFRRGSHRGQHVRRSLFGLRKTTLDLEIFDEVVLFAAVKPVTADPTLKKRRRPPKARPGSVIIKLFHDIASADVDALYPDVRVVMSNVDKLMLGLPALFGGIPLLIKLAPAALVIYGLIRFYLGEKSPDSHSTAEALIVASGLVALGGFLMQQWTKYDRRALRYQKEVSDLLYFHNVTNNVGIFDHLIGVAEEQEAKEVLLAYFVLLARGPTSEADLDRLIEDWLERHFSICVDFEVDDALGKLKRYGVLLQNGEMFSVEPLPRALAAFDRHWEGFFPREAVPAESEPANGALAQDETAYLLSNPANAERLLASISEAEAGRVMQANWPE